jgi:hypothetical protein
MTIEEYINTAKQLLAVLQLQDNYISDATEQIQIDSYYVMREMTIKMTDKLYDRIVASYGIMTADSICADLYNYISE